MDSRVSFNSSFADNASLNTKSSSEANKSDVNKFDRAMQDENNSKTNDKADKNATHEPHDKASGKKDEVENLSDIFSKLLNTSQDTHANQSFTSSTNVGADKSSLAGVDLDKLDELTNKLVDKILVSDPKMSGGSEIRLIMSKDTPGLQGSEIILRRDLEGALAIEINCKNRDQFKKYVQVRGDLVNALEKHEKGVVNFILNEDYPEGEVDHFASYIKNS